MEFASAEWIMNHADAIADAIFRPAMGPGWRVWFYVAEGAILGHVYHTANTRPAEGDGPFFIADVVGEFDGGADALAEEIYLDPRPERWGA